jgi:predicted short-subunit dehydrogenase-like oxidoreductase (DUF2520 family)
MKQNILIIGFGKLGSNLYYGLKKIKGFNPEVIKSSRSRIDKTQIKSAGTIFICARDSEIMQVVKQIVSTDVSLKKKIIFHTSGSLTSDELLKLASKGAVTASFHPVQTFEKRVKNDIGRFGNIYIALEGKPQAIKAGKQIASLLGSKSFVLKKAEKVYHHICCVIASNFLTALNRQIEKIISKKIRINGFKKASFFNIYMPLAMQSLKNTADEGAVNALTGPFERNDIVTIEKHLDALKRGSGDVLPVYILMGIETVKLSLEKKSLSISESKKIMQLLSKYIIKQ